jgi:1,2-diacylglycerol 3-alpha-glucosyltransferase
MKLAYLCQSYPPMISGAALVVERHARLMAAAGHEVVVMCASDKKSSYTSTSSGVKVFRMRSYKNPFRIQQRFVLWPKAEIATVLKTFQPDILHFHDPTMTAFAGLAAVREMDFPPVKMLTLHQLPWFVSSYFPPLRNMIETVLWMALARLQQSFHVMLTPSEMIADIVGAHTGRRPVVIGNGINLERFTPCPGDPDERKLLCEKYKIDPNKPVILSVGRMDPDKRVDLIVDAARQIFASVDAQLVIVGNGKCLEQIRELIQRQNIDQHCCTTGFVSCAGDLPGLYRLGSVFCTASVMEVQSSVVLEAMAAGLPVVAFRASSMPELISDGESGYLVPPLNTEEFAKYIVKLLQNPAQARAMGQVGYRIAHEKHSNTAAAGALLGLYESTILSIAENKNKIPGQKLPASVR